MISLSDPFDRLPTARFGTVYVVGDVHGRRDLLDEMLDWAAADAGSADNGEACVVSVGDMVDRGPDPAGVVEVFAAGRRKGLSLRAIRGNHEDMLIDTLDGVDPSVWLMNGGLETLSGYGCSDAAAFARGIPADHEEFLRRIPLAYLAGDHLIVHAGIRPGVEPRDQEPVDLMWIREPFLSDTAPRPYVVVHGHTIVPEPVVTPNRVGIDTGAWKSGILTCLALGGRTRRIRQTGGKPYALD